MTDLVPGRPTIARIQDHVAAHYGIDAAEMRSERRTAAISWPRHVAMYLARRLTPHSSPVIGRHFGRRDHTTVLHGCRRVEAAMAEEPDISAEVEILRAEIVALCCGPLDAGEAAVNALLSVRRSVDQIAESVERDLHRLWRLGARVDLLTDTLTGRSEAAAAPPKLVVNNNPGSGR